MLVSRRVACHDAFHDVQGGSAGGNEAFMDVTKSDMATVAPEPTAKATTDHNATVPAIELVGIAKRFHSRRGTVTAVERVDLVIGEGEFFSLLGPSGCGKTTTLRMIGGFEEPTEGQILLYGNDVVGVPPNHRDVNMVFQSYALFPHMSVFDNVAFGLRRKGVGSAEAKKRVDEMLELVQLEGKSDRRPRELSGGQQQRVALGPGAGQPAACAAAGRAARRARPQTAPGDADSSSSASSARSASPSSSSRTTRTRR